MAVSSRRNFLRQASLGAAAVGTVAVSPLLFESRSQAGSVQAEAPAIPLDAPIVALLKDSRHGVFTLMVGEREISFTDKQLAARLSRAVQ